MIMQDSFSEQVVYLGRTLLIAGAAILAAVIASAF